MLILLVLAALLAPARCPPPPSAAPRGPAPTPKSTPGARDEEATTTEMAPDWVCPKIGAEWVAGAEGEADNGSGKRRSVTCSCDLPHTLRCTGGADTLQVVGAALRALPLRYVSLLDASVSGVSVLSEPLLPDVALHGLVVSGDLKAVEPQAFSRLLQDGAEPRLQALGLPGNLLDEVPVAALRALPDLDRLDLSHNRLRSLPTDSFPGLQNLTFLDLSDNQLSELAAGAFRSLVALRVLRLTGNRLRAAPLSLLEGLRALEELDLSSNQLAGPLGPAALPRLPQLRTLNLAHNQLSSVRRGALAGTPALASLALQHNMVDVLEDHAFRHLAALTSLDLAYNRIVAVSGASLAHLARLRVLSLQHNFLRALTADLVRPLTALQELHLDDNDISQVSPDALEAAGRLSRITLVENPLNCDCALAPFARWLHNASRLSASDRASAVCAAPPHLENGLLEDVASADLLCQDAAAGQDGSGRAVDPDAALRPGLPGLGPAGGRSQPLSDTRVALRAFQFNGSRVSLLWGVNTTASPYVCDALVVYEEGAGREVLLESTPLGCDSSQLADPRSLLLFLPAEHLAAGRRYRFCLVLLEGGGAQDDLALVVGCSDVLALVQTAAPLHPAGPGSAGAEGPPGAPRISGLSANMTASGSLAVWVQLSPSHALAPACRLTVAVFAAGALAAQERVNCSLPGTVIGGLGAGPLQVCATAGETAGPASRTRCTSVVGRATPLSGPAPSMTAGLVAALVGLLTATLAALLLTLWLAARWSGWRRRASGAGLPGGMARDTGQLYRPPPPSEYEQHSRYVKLQATTKL